MTTAPGSQDILFTPFTLGRLSLRNRLVMAPMSRHRADAGCLPHSAAALYYGQRASAGLIISEGTQTSLQAKGFPGVPGIYTPEQIAAWRDSADAVHAAGGAIFVQLWHCGRVSHSSIQPDGRPPLAPSAILANATAVKDDGTPIPVDMPRAFEEDEIADLIDEFVNAAANAIDAGCDGVELHAANGYLLHQFLCDGANQRADRYGGSPANRCRLVVEIAAAAAERIGADRVGIRISPTSTYQGVADSDPLETYGELLPQLGALGIAYVHAVEGFGGQSRDVGDFSFEAIRSLFPGPWIANNMYDGVMAAEAISSGYADLVSLGRPFIANPDLVERLYKNAALNSLDRATLYGGGEPGYVDYPFLDATAQNA